MPPTNLASRIRLREQPQPPRQRVVVPGRGRVQTLVEVAQAARTDGERLVDNRTHHLAVADALRPGRPFEGDVVGARKGVVFRVRQPGPVARRAVRGPGAEVALAVAADGLDDQQVLPVADAVDVRGLVQAELVAVGSGERDDGLAHALGEAT